MRLPEWALDVPANYLSEMERRAWLATHDLRLQHQKLSELLAWPREEEEGMTTSSDSLKRFKPVSINLDRAITPQLMDRIEALEALLREAKQWLEACSACHSEEFINRIVAILGEKGKP